MSSRKEQGVNVQVLLRCRPFSDEELRTNATQVVTCNDYQREVDVSQNIVGKHIDKVFTFDKFEERKFEGERGKRRRKGVEGNQYTSFILAGSGKGK